ncbi:MAG: hypothetical protein HYY93_00605 [Planctomycetes bacterium]|nr:hypothetical protein [Planctomycetota bacterium]
MRIQHLTRRGVERRPTVDVKKGTGTRRDSAPEAAAHDPLHYPIGAGHFGNIATVLSELAEKMDPDRLVDAARSEGGLPVAQRPAESLRRNAPRSEPPNCHPERSPAIRSAGRSEGSPALPRNTRLPGGRPGGPSRPPAADAQDDKSAALVIPGHFFSGSELRVTMQQPRTGGGRMTTPAHHRHPAPKSSSIRRRMAGLASRRGLRMRRSG